MLFSTTKIIFGVAALFAATTAAQSDCDRGPWARVSHTGGNNGAGFCATKYKAGIVITGVEVWADTKSVRAIQFFYSDGTNSQQWGKINGDRKGRLNWDPSTDSISQVKTWGNGKGQFLGRVQIRTKSGKELDVGKDTNGQDTFESDVGSGIMLGAFGASGDVIDRLGFLFLKSKVTKVTIDDVKFKDTPADLNKRKEGIEMVTVDYADHVNTHPNATQNFKFEKSSEKSISKKYINTGTSTFGFSQAFEISGKILDLGGSSTTTLAYEYSKSNTEEIGNDSKVTLTYAVETELQPGQRIYCRAQAMRGSYRGTYSSTVNVWLADGTKFGFQQGGTMDQVSWSSASSECNGKPFTDKTKMVTKRATKFIA